MKSFIDVLQSSGIFKGIAEEDIYSMLGCLSAVKKKFKKGEYLYRAGDNASMTSLVLDGTVYVYRADYWGNMNILSRGSKGDMLGEVYSILEDEPMQVSVVAMEDSIVLFLDMKKVFSTCASVCPHHAAVIRNLAGVLAAKNKELAGKMEHLTQPTTRAKLLSYLSDESLKSGRNDFEIPFNRQQLADYLSVDRSAMSKELGKLKREGIVDFNKNHFRLMDRETKKV